MKASRARACEVRNIERIRRNNAGDDRPAAATGDNSIISRLGAIDEHEQWGQSSAAKRRNTCTIDQLNAVMKQLSLAAAAAAAVGVGASANRCTAPRCGRDSIPCRWPQTTAQSRLNKEAQLTQGLRAPSFQDGRQPPSWILSNRK